MNNKWIYAALGLAAMSASAVAQKASGAENALVGIKLYDTGIRVVSIYGTPDAVQAVGGGGNAIGPGGGGGGGRPGGPGGFGPAGGGRPGGPSMSPLGASHDPGAFGDQFLQQMGETGAGTAGGPSAPVSEGGATSGPPGRGAPAGGAPVGGGGGNVGNAGTGGRILFTRWVYNRNGSKYGFVLDKSNRVVQIEAIGLTNSRVKTSRGITFGSTFAQLIRKYNAPDGYEINGENVVVRFLVKNKVAFRLSRLGQNKPQVVTGIVVAAGKT